MTRRRSSSCSGVPSRAATIPTRISPTGVTLPIQKIQPGSAGGSVFSRLATWLFIAVSLRYSSLAALVAAAAAPMFAVLFWGSDVLVLAVGIIAMALIGKHWQNLQRLMSGTEPKIGAKKTAAGSVRAAAHGSSRRTAR